MRVLVIASPLAFVDLAEAKEQCRIDGDDEDSLISGMVDAACATIDGPDGWLGRAIGQQTLEARFDGFDSGDPITLPCPPVVGIDSVVYLDAAGAPQTLASNQYEAFGPSVEPAFGMSWPTSRPGREAVRIRYQAGYDTVPAPIRAAVLLMVGDLYENRQTTVDARASAAAAVPMSTTVENLLWPFRVWR